MNRILILILFLVFFSCREKSVPDVIEKDLTDSAIVKDLISYQIFRNSSTGFGFNIFKNKKLYIHQPIIPTSQGLHPFPSKEEAEAIAILITKRLQKCDFRFLLNSLEVDSLMKKSAALRTNAVALTTNVKATVLTASTEHDTTNALQFTALPVLPKMPLKKRWISKGIVPFGSRAGALCFSIGDCIYIGGGELEDETINDLWSYNVITETWTCLANFTGERRMGGIAFSTKLRGYWGLGQRKGIGFRTYLKDFYQYDPTLNEWHKKKDFRGTARIDAAAFSIDDRGYVGLGFDGEYKKDFYQYDVGRDRWERICNFAGGPIAASLGVSTPSKGFIVGGDNQAHNQKFVFEYVPLQNKWERRRDLSGEARYYLSGNNIDSSHFIAGSGLASAGTVQYRDFYLFDAIENSWQKIPDYFAPAAGNMKAATGSAKGKVFMAAAFNSTSKNKWNAFEYYFSPRKDTGIYNETICYPLHYNGNWQLYQECSNDDCFAGISLRSAEQLGNVCYASYYKLYRRELNLLDKKFFVLPRSFSMQSQNQPKQQTGIRLFFTRAELLQALNEQQKKRRQIFSLDDVKILQCNERDPDCLSNNNLWAKNSFHLLQPTWYRYGENSETVVAEFATPTIHSEFYAVVTLK